MTRFSIIFLFIVTVISGINGQSTSTFADSIKVSNHLYTRLYGELIYNQKLADDIRHNGVLDVRRIVLMFGYQPSERIQFVSEIEFEHANEIFVEQAFVKYHISNLLNFRAGLLLIPSGIVNEDHEPTSFYTTDRPFLDNVIVPSTWREMGLGISGLSLDYSLRYQLYFVNGLLSYDGQNRLGGSSGLRGGRQKGIKSTISGLPALTTKVEYFGIPQLKVGLSAYVGKTQSTAYNGLDQNDVAALSMADSTVVDISLLSAHLIYKVNRFQIKSQFSWAKVNNTEAYNNFTDSDLGNNLYGYYGTVAYTLREKNLSRLDAFVQYSKVNTHAATESGSINDAYNKEFFTVGINWFPHPSVVFKIDHQFITDGTGHSYQQFNTGIGVWF